MYKFILSILIAIVINSTVLAQGIYFTEVSSDNPNSFYSKLQQVNLHIIQSRGESMYAAVGRPIIAKEINKHGEEFIRYSFSMGEYGDMTFIHTDYLFLESKNRVGLWRIRLDTRYSNLTTKVPIGQIYYGDSYDRAKIAVGLICGMDISSAEKLFKIKSVSTKTQINEVYDYKSGKKYYLYYIHSPYTNTLYCDLYAEEL